MIIFSGRLNAGLLQKNYKKLCLRKNIAYTQILLTYTHKGNSMKLLVRIMIMGLINFSLMSGSELPGSAPAITNHDELITDNWEGIDPTMIPDYVPPSQKQLLMQRFQKGLAEMSEGEERELAQLNQIPPGQLVQLLLAKQRDGQKNSTVTGVETIGGSVASGYQSQHSSTSIARRRGRGDLSHASGRSILGALWHGLKDFAGSLQD